MTTEQKTALSYSPFETIRTPDGKIDHSFGPYSETREHLNGWLSALLSKVGVSDGLNVELGSGRGHSGENILPYVGVTGKMIMSEPDNEAYNTCVQKYGQDGRVEVRNKSALEMLRELEDGSVDRIYYLNAIHLDEDREEVAELAFRKLKPGGLFIANSSFVYEAVPASESRFYPRWMATAYDVLKRLDRELYQYLRDNKENLKHMHRAKKAEYDELFTSNGFSLRDLAPYGLAFDQPDSQLQNSFVGLFRIAQYHIWINGTMPFEVIGEDISDDERKRRLDVLTRAQQGALLDIYPKMIGPRISPRNNAIWVAEKPDVASRRGPKSTGTWASPRERYPIPVDVA